MSDHLSDVFRANVRAGLRLRGMSQQRLSRTMGAHPQAIHKLLLNQRGIGVTLATVDRVSQALGIESAVMVTPGGVQRSRAVRVLRTSTDEAA